MRALFFFLFSFSLALRADSYSIGWDSSWYPADFKEKTPKINLFIQRYVQNLTSPTSTISLLNINEAQMMRGLEENKLDAILTTKTPNIETLQKFDFSEPLIDLSLVLIVPSSSHKTRLSHFKGQLVAISAFDNSVTVVEKQSAVFIREYDNMNVALTDLVRGHIDAVVMSRLEAYPLVQGLYCKVLKIIPKALDNSGIRLVTLKGTHKDLIELFNSHSYSTSHDSRSY